MRINMIVRIILSPQAMFPSFLLVRFEVTGVKKLRFHGDGPPRNRLCFRILMPLVGKLLRHELPKTNLGSLSGSDLNKIRLMLLEKLH